MFVVYGKSSMGIFHDNLFCKENENYAKTIRHEYQTPMEEKHVQKYISIFCFDVFG